MQCEKISEGLKALSDPMRRRILAQLPDEANCTRGNNVSQLADTLGAPQPSISHHLKVLRMAGLVDFRKMCRDVFYWRNPDALHRLIDGMGDSISFDLREKSEPVAKS